MISEAEQAKRLQQPCVCKQLFLHTSPQLILNTDIHKELQFDRIVHELKK